MKIKVLGAHNTESRNTKYMSLLVDDIIAIDAGGLTSGLSFRAQMNIKAVLLTHGHYDHIRDIPAFGMNLYLRRKSADIYTHQPVLDNLNRHFLNGDLYPEFQEKPAGNPTLRLHLLEAYRETSIESYKVLPATMNHKLPTLGYQVTGPDGKSMFYTGDTGPDLSSVWERISPQALFIELTASNKWETAMKDNGHLTPHLLQQELARFREIKGYLPQIYCVHLNPEGEKEIKSEILAVIDSLGMPIKIAYEGMLVKL